MPSVTILLRRYSFKILFKPLPKMRIRLIEKLLDVESHKTFELFHLLVYQSRQTAAYNGAKHTLKNAYRAPLMFILVGSTARPLERNPRKILVVRSFVSKHLPLILAVRELINLVSNHIFLALIFLHRLIQFAVKLLS